MGIFFRKLWKNKPKQWGPWKAVHAAFMRNAEKIGIDPLSVELAIPLWEGADLLHDYSDATVSNAFLGSAAWTNQGIRLLNPTASRVPLGKTISFADNTPYTLLTRFRKDGADTTKTIIAGLDSSTVLDYLQAVPGNRFRFKLAVSMNFTNITDFSKMGTIGITCDGAATGVLNAYQEGIFKQSLSSSNTAYSFNSLGSQSPTYCVDDMIWDQFLAFSIDLDETQIGLLSDNPYQLWQPVPQKTIFLPQDGGGLTLNLSDTINLSDALINGIGLNKADTISMSDIISNQPEISFSDTINMSDLISKFINISKSDTITLSDQISTLIALTLSLSDTIAMSDSISKQLYIVKSDSITMSDAFSKVSEFIRTFSDQIDMSDQISKEIGITKADIITLSDTFSTSEEVIYALVNFLAKERVFNFTAKNKTFNFTAKNKNFNFGADPRGKKP